MERMSVQELSATLFGILGRKTIESKVSMLKCYNETVKAEEGRQDHLSLFVMRKLSNAAYLWVWKSCDPRWLFLHVDTIYRPTEVQVQSSSGSSSSVWVCLCAFRHSVKSILEWTSVTVTGGVTGSALCYSYGAHKRFASVSPLTWIFPFSSHSHTGAFLQFLFYLFDRILVLWKPNLNWTKKRIETSIESIVLWNLFWHCKSFY